MISSSLGTASYGQFPLGSVPEFFPQELLPAPPGRTYSIGVGENTFIAYKTPNEIKNYSFDWSCILENGDFIVESTWSCDSSDVSILQAAINASSLTTVLISGGIIGNQYIITNQIFTENGLILEASFALVVIQYNSA